MKCEFKISSCSTVITTFLSGEMQPLLACHKLVVASHTAPFVQLAVTYAVTHACVLQRIVGTAWQSQPSHFMAALIKQAALVRHDSTTWAVKKYWRARRKINIIADTNSMPMSHIWQTSRKLRRHTFIYSRSLVLGVYAKARSTRVFGRYLPWRLAFYLNLLVVFTF